MLSARYGIPQSTIYYRLDRLEERGLEGVLKDERRPGHPPKLTVEECAEVESRLVDPPEDAEEWTTRRLQQRIAEGIDVEYSAAHVHRRFLS